MYKLKNNEQYKNVTHGKSSPSVAKIHVSECQPYFLLYPETSLKKETSF